MLNGNYVNLLSPISSPCLAVRTMTREKACSYPELSTNGFNLLAVWHYTIEDLSLIYIIYRFSRSHLADRFHWSPPSFLFSRKSASSGQISSDSAKNVVNHDKNLYLFLLRAR